MGVGRIIATSASVAAVAGCAVLVAQLSRAGGANDIADTPLPLPTTSAHSFTYRPWPGQAPDTSDATGQLPAGQQTSGSAAPAVSSGAAPSSTAKQSPPRADPGASTATQAAPAAPAPAARPGSAAPPAPAPPAPVGQSLPVGGSTAGATRVITVRASSYSSTTATLQAWNKAPGGGWLPYGGPLLAHVGSQGLTTAPNESLSATPIGSFTLTQAFGAYSNPGTPLPYFQTNSADWWISQSGPLYNTHQHCSSGCSFNLGDPNEHLAYETPYYNYAVVIDYNTPNSATGVRQGAGSAFFLHVTDGSPTAGCVAIAQNDLVRLMKWLTPSARPRILIGVG